MLPRPVPGQGVGTQQATQSETSVTSLFSARLVTSGAQSQNRQALTLREDPGGVSDATVKGRGVAPSPQTRVGAPETPGPPGECRVFDTQ